MLTPHPCDLCGSDDASEVPYARLYTNDQPIHICKGCGFVYVRYRRPPREVAEAWSEIYRDDYAGDRYTARIPAVKARHAYVAAFLDDAFPLRGKRVCDIGAGEGYFLRMLRDEYGAYVFGIEPSPRNHRRMKEMGIDSFLGTVEEYAAVARPESFDAATIVWTLENTSSCHNMLQAAWRLLSAGGHILVATGSRILVPFKKPLFNYLGTNPADTHCFRFSAASLETVLALNHFRVLTKNRYLDSDILCAVAQKVDPSVDLPQPKDDPDKVAHFFERWHRETAYY